MAEQGKRWTLRISERGYLDLEGPLTYFDGMKLAPVSEVEQLEEVLQGLVDWLDGKGSAKSVGGAPEVVKARGVLSDG